MTKFTYKADDQCRRAQEMTKFTYKASMRPRSRPSRFRAWEQRSSIIGTVGSLFASVFGTVGTPLLPGKEGTYSSKCRFGLRHPSKFAGFRCVLLAGKEGTYSSGVGAGGLPNSAARSRPSPPTRSSNIHVVHICLPFLREGGLRIQGCAPAADP